MICPRSAKPRWTKPMIRQARKVELAPLLQKCGLALRDRGGGNFEPELYRGIFIKASYWRWPDRDRAGNTIDFFIHVQGKTFHQAMEIITGADDYDAAEQFLREECGNDREILR